MEDAMEDARIIKLNVITEDKSIKRYPVIIPNYIFDENTSCEYDKIIDLYVIINDTIKTHSVIIPKDLIANFVKQQKTNNENKKRKISINIDEQIETNKLQKSIDNLFYEIAENNRNEMDVNRYFRKENVMTNVSVPAISIPSVSVPIPLVSPLIKNEHVSFSNNKSIVSSLSGNNQRNERNEHNEHNERNERNEHNERNERNEYNEKTAINMIDNIIEYINRSFKSFDSLYMKLTDKEYSGIENYFRTCFKLNILNREILYINKNILYNTQIIWTNLNPEINVYVVKYPINDYDSSIIIENIKRKTTDLVIFCEKVLRWVKFCIDNKIETKEQKKFINMKMNIYNRFFLTDQFTRKYWRKYGLNIPMDYINERLNSNVKIVFINSDIFYVNII